MDNDSSSVVVSDKFMAQVESLIYQKVNEERAKAGLQLYHIILQWKSMQELNHKIWVIIIISVRRFKW